MIFDDPIIRIWVPCIVGSILMSVFATIVHEFGHAIVGRICGMNITDIQIGTPGKNGRRRHVTLRAGGINYTVFWPPSKGETIEAPIEHAISWKIRAFAIGGFAANAIIGLGFSAVAFWLYQRHHAEVLIQLANGEFSGLREAWGVLLLLSTLGAVNQFVEVLNLIPSRTLLTDGYALLRPVDYHRLKSAQRREAIAPKTMEP